MRIIPKNRDILILLSELDYRRLFYVENGREVISLEKNFRLDNSSVVPFFRRMTLSYNPSFRRQGEILPFPHNINSSGLVKIEIDFRDAISYQLEIGRKGRKNLEESRPALLEFNGRRPFFYLWAPGSY
jgi:hypothetical protein